MLSLGQTLLSCSGLRDLLFDALEDFVEHGHRCVVVPRIILGAVRSVGEVFGTAIETFLGGLQGP